MPVQQQDDDDDEDDIKNEIPRPRPNDGRQDCPHCGRYFDPDRLDKHMAVCTKGKEKRKRFDSSAMRKKGTDLDPNKAPVAKNTLGFY